MKLAVIAYEGAEKVVVRKGEDRYLLMDVAPEFDMSLADLIKREQLEALSFVLEGVAWDEVEPLSLEEWRYLLPKTQSRHVFGIGANYVEKAEDLNIVAEKPVCFLKLSEQIVGPDEVIEIPRFSELVSAEGELALLIGKRCFEVTESEALHYVAGYTTALDLTAKDLHAENPRFLQISKLFPGSCSIGPEIQLGTKNLHEVEVRTMKNGEAMHRNVVANMMYSPAAIVAYLSQFVALEPGDWILTGTPGSFEVELGDSVQCYISGLALLENPIR